MSERRSSVLTNLVAAYRYEQDTDGVVSCKLTMSERMQSVAVDVPSPSDMTGTGATLDEALKDYVAQLEQYIGELNQFRKDLMQAVGSNELMVRTDERGFILTPDKERT